MIDAPHDPDDTTEVPVQTDNREREGIDPAQDVSQDPEVSYSEVSL